MAVVCISSIYVQNSVQFTQSWPTTCNPKDFSLPAFPAHHQLLEIAQTHVHLVGHSIQPSHSLLSPSPPAFSLFQHQGLFLWVAPLIRWSKYLSFSFSISPSNEYSGLISFRIDLFELLVVQRTLKNLLQHHSSKASVLQCSAYFMVQLPHLYMLLKKP